MEKISHTIEVFSATSSELPDYYQNLIEHSRNALETSYSPYSNFPVGSAILLENGEIVSGSNQENAAYPSGLCAERTALFSVGTQHKGQNIMAIAISLSSVAKEFPYPCGSCLQVMSEFERKQSQPFDVLMVHPQKDEVLWSKGLKNLLPFAFNKTHLGK